MSEKAINTAEHKILLTQIGKGSKLNIKSYASKFGKHCWRVFFLL
jgi:hypothetical protein